MRRVSILLPWCFALSIILPAPAQVPETAIAPQAVRPGGGWPVSSDDYDPMKIRELNKKIAQRDFMDITSVVVIKDGK
ncbi:MAG: hypothetical protein ACXWHJ_12225, partial [Candidatus Aminicenantales bacterium]